MLVNKTYGDLNNICRKLNSLPEKERLRVALELATQEIILDRIFLILSGIFDYDSYFNICKEAFNSKPRILNLVQAAEIGTIQYLD